MTPGRAAHDPGSQPLQTILRPCRSGRQEGRSFVPHCASSPLIRSQASTLQPAAGASATSTTTAARGGSFNETDALYNHSWAPGPGQRGADTYADLAAAKADAEARKREREGRIALEQREAEIERKERDLRRKQDMASIEARRQREAAEEAERRRKMKEDSKKKPAQQQRPKFDLQREKPQIMVSIANAIQAASVLVNACRVSRSRVRERHGESQGAGRTGQGQGRSKGHHPLHSGCDGRDTRRNSARREREGRRVDPAVRQGEWSDIHVNRQIQRTICTDEVCLC
jgi:Skp family chaperone for outer membrane proteins